MTTLALPRPGQPGTFRRLLAAAERRKRRAGGSGSAYPLIVLTCFYAPAVILGAATQLTSPMTSPVWLAPAPAVLLLAAALALTSAGWSLLGPIPVSPAWGAWVLPTPLDRGTLLAHRVWMRAPSAALVGLALGTFGAMAAGMRGSGAVALLTTAVAGGLLAYAAAVKRQTRPDASLWRPGALAAVLVTAAVAAQTWFTATVFDAAAVTVSFQGAVWWSLAAATAAVAVLATVGAASWAGRIPPHRLTAAHAASRGMVLAFTELSLEPVGTGLANTGRRHGRRAGVRSRPFAGTGRAALASLTWRRLWRGRTGLVRFAIAAAVFYPLALVGRGASHTPQVLAVAGVIAASLALSGVAGTARHLQRSPHLAASFGLDPRAARRTALVAPTVMAAVWAALVSPAMLLGGAAWAGPPATALGYAVVVYRLSRPEFTPTYVMGMQYPVDLGLRFARGPAQLVLACLVAALLATAF